MRALPVLTEDLTTRVRPIYRLADTDISIPANWISVISISASVSANLDMGYIGIGKISVKKHGYRPKNRLKCLISAKYW